MTTPTTGFLATECASCDGKGRITWKQGLEQLQYSADCADCRGEGWTVHEEIPAIATDEANRVLREERAAFAAQVYAYAEADRVRSEEHRHGGCGARLCDECKQEESAPEPCPGECTDGWIITNPDWPAGDLHHRERCPYLGDSDFAHAHPTFEELRR